MLSLLFLCGVVRFVYSDDAKKKSLEGFIALKGYYDTRDRTMFTFKTLATLPADFEYFGFINFFTALDAPTDLSLYYTEQNLLWKLPKNLPLGLNVQLVSTSGSGNDLARFALRWDPSSTPVLEDFFKKIHMWYVIYFHLLQTDFHPSPGWGWQIEHVYRIDLFPKTFHKRVSLQGFADHDMNYGGARGNDNNSWVFEHQLNVRLIAGLHAVAQVRHEEFLPKQTGFGAGLEYGINF